MPASTGITQSQYRAMREKLWESFTHYSKIGFDAPVSQEAALITATTVQALVALEDYRERNSLKPD